MITDQEPARVVKVPRRCSKVRVLEVVRRQTGISVDELAALIGVSGGTITGIERGEVRLPLPRTCIALEKYFRLPIAELLAIVDVSVER